jgi:hypothetical protein
MGFWRQKVPRHQKSRNGHSVSAANFQLTTKCHIGCPMLMGLSSSIDQPDLEGLRNGQNTRELFVSIK